ncbi:unnamed protein product, partial [Urochloa humidicola]
DQLIKAEEREIGDTGLKPYILYLCQSKGYIYASLCVISHMVFIAGQISQNSWMAANVQSTEVSSDLSTVDLDVPFAFMFSISASLNAYSNLGVLAVVTWQVLFISVPVIIFAIRLQAL